MATLPNVRDLPHSRKPTAAVLAISPRHGVVTLSGYGIVARVERGHLILHDGVGDERREGRLPRVGHDLRRLVVIGSDGCISLAALRWLADQHVSFAMLERDGTVLATTGPVRPSDAKLRRAQALARYTGADMTIAKELIRRKIAGQAKVAREQLRDDSAANVIANIQQAVVTAATLDDIRALEARAAAAYWSAWACVPIMFPRGDLDRIPEHWRVFGTRASQLTGSPRLATNPANAMLNYLYAILEAESRLAAAALGLDPGLGVLHMDTTARDSLACDLMEACRPNVDAYVLRWIMTEPLRREWLFETPQGNCRLMSAFASRLAETGLTWTAAVAPVAEWTAHAFWQTTKQRTRQPAPATRLTQTHKRIAKQSSTAPSQQPPQPDSVCRICGKPLEAGRQHCADCHRVHSHERMTELAQRGRIAAQGADAQARRGDTQRAHNLAQATWKPENQPSWLTEQVYQTEIQPRLATITVRALAAALGVSLGYAADVRAGRRRPHPRHWIVLAQMAGAGRT